MIDINLQKLKPKPEKEPSSNQPGRLRKIILPVIVAILILFFWRDIYEVYKMINPSYTPPREKNFEPPDTPQQQAAEPDTTIISTEPETLPPEEPETIPQPEPETEPPIETVSWDYGRSIEHLSAFTALVRALPENSDYTVASVSDDGVIAEIKNLDAVQMFDAQTAISNALSQYNFDFSPLDSVLQVNGALKSTVELPDDSPSPDYMTPEANIDAIVTLSKAHNVKYEPWRKTSESERENVSFLPVWIRLTGAENNILNFLDDIKEKRLNLRITKISIQGSGGNRADAPVSLYFEFEIIM